MNPQERLEELLGCKITTYEEKVECNHYHDDVLRVSFQGTKKQFPKAKVCYSHPLNEDGSIDLDKGWEHGHFWTKEELAEKRQKEIEKYVPLLLRERRGRCLLRKHLSDEQWKYYRKHGQFALVSQKRVFVVGGYYGVQELNKHGEPFMSYCLHGKAHDLPQSDVLLLQKLLLETDLQKFLEVANARETDYIPDINEPTIENMAREFDSIIMENDEIDYGKLEWLQMEYEGSLRFKLPMEWERAFEEVKIDDPVLQKRILESIANNEYVVYNERDGMLMPSFVVHL